ncbi:RHS repeat-associated core domain-containing protein [Flavobacterium branchiophilum]|uniref:RHS repeat domain-containing protein n=1 Tax=Flavobacterium branchiophilum TaxID=55197 RepID=UPI0005C52A12|nr:RHS repeat-associated core domain-containing protein [Flavobacterium branchiophilum]
MGEVSQHSEYFAFGETFVEEHKNSHNSPYKFNGKELDEESGLYYYGARYYDPRISIWASVDPLAEVSPHESPYVYCSNNPIMFVDPTGMIKELPDDQKLGKGDWHKSDRINGTKIWQEANKYNLKQKNGNLEYNSIPERTAFYKWFQLETEDMGFETKWAGGAYVIAYQMGATGGIGKDAGLISERMIKFANEGNKAIFDDVFDDLGKLYSGLPLKGKDAKNWDIKILTHEQKDVVAPIYNKQTNCCCKKRIK